jgi:hypothetical protein
MRANVKEKDDQGLGQTGSDKFESSRAAETLS